MVDSEDSTSLRSVSRRTLLGGAISTPLASTPILNQRATPVGDPILSLWRDWECAFAEAATWSAEWGGLESKLVCQVGFPRVLVPSPPAVCAVWATSHEVIDRELSDVLSRDDLRKRLHSDLTDQVAKWDAAAKAIGLDETDHQADHAWKKSEEIAGAIFALPACGIPGVIAKLELILRMGQTQSDDGEFPWGQLRSTIADLRRLVNDASSL